MKSARWRWDGHAYAVQMGSTTSLLALSAPPAARVALKTQVTALQRLLAAQPALVTAQALAVVAQPAPSPPRWALTPSALRRALAPASLRRAQPARANV